MGEHHLLTTAGQDVAVGPPAPGDVLCGNGAGAWQALPLTEPLAQLVARIEALELAVEQLLNP